MEKNSSKKGDIKISLLGLLIGISLIVAGVYGIVSNKIENQEYKNSTDIRTVNAVVEECRRKDSVTLLLGYCSRGYVTEARTVTLGDRQAVLLGKDTR